MTQQQHKVHVYKDEAGEFRWKRVAHNGNVVSDSGEGYKNSGDCIKIATEVNSDAELVFDFKTAE